MVKRTLCAGFPVVDVGCSAKNQGRNSNILSIAPIIVSGDVLTVFYGGRNGNDYPVRKGALG